MTDRFTGIQLATSIQLAPSGPSVGLSLGTFKAPPKTIRLVAMMHVRRPPSLRNVDDSLLERWIDITHLA